MVLAYVINMDKDIDRLRHMYENLSKLGIEFVRIAAVNGNALTNEQLEKYSVTVRGQKWSSSGALGCFLSHRAVWQEIVRRDENWGLVLEDDIYLSRDFKNYITEELLKTTVTKDADIIRLEATTNRVKLKQRKKFFDRDIYKLVSTTWCTGAYLITQQTAKKLLAVSEDLWDSSDYFLFCQETSPVARNLNIYQLNPAIAVQEKHNEEILIKHFESRIEQSKSGAIFKKNLNSGLFSKCVKLFKLYRKVQFKD